MTERMRRLSDALPWYTPITMDALPSAATDLVPPDRLRQMAEEFFGSLGALTRKAYQRDLRCFAAFMGTDHIGEALRQLMAAGPGEAFSTVTRYRTHLQTIPTIHGASINRRLGALRTLLRFARSCGLVAWTVEVKNVRADALRDTRGPNSAGIARLFAACEGTAPAMVRDRAILRLLYSAALRRAEVSTLDVEHFDPVGARVSVLGKGRELRQWVPVARSVVRDVGAWAVLRGGTSKEPLFVNFDPTKKGREGDRLMPEGVWEVVKRAAKRAGFRKYELSSHSLRHSGVTFALEQTNGNVAKVQKFSRHKDVRTVIIYNDNRTDAAREIADLMDGPDAG